METLPRWRVPPAPPSSGPGLDSLAWDEVPAFALLTRAAGDGPPEQATTVRVCHDGITLYVRFDCEDRDAWGTFTYRDDPIYQEEAVELFLAPGEADPTRYYEFELSPQGVLFDAIIHNPTSQRADMTANPTWDCPGILWSSGSGGLVSQSWWAALAIPWSSIAPPSTSLPRLWRANFYRIERPRDGAPEFSCWSPTLTDPADFHKPARFGALEL
jgi:hypothetical protein